MLIGKQSVQKENKMIIEVENLKKSYGSLVALEDLNLSVAEGEVFGLLGPNGSGKPPPSTAFSPSWTMTTAGSGSSGRTWPPML